MNRSARTWHLAIQNLLLASIFIIPSKSSAQSVTLGPLVGINFSNFVDPGRTGTDSQPGLHAGAFVDIGLSDYFSIRTEVLYTEKGISLDESDYVEFPVFASLRFPITRYVSSRLMLGPAVGFPISDPDGIVFSGRRELGDPCTESVCLPTKVLPPPNIDIALVFGGAIDLDLGNRTISVDAHYNFGIRRIHSGSDFKNRSFVVAVGLGFPIGS